MNKNLLQEHEDIYGFKNEYRWLSNFYKLQEPIDLYGCVFYYTENLLGKMQI